jgi:hypothetical protein
MQEPQAVQLKIKQIFGAKWQGDVSMPFSCTTLQLKQKLYEITAQPVPSMKLMCAGKILKNELTLLEQKVGSTKTSSMIMLMEDKSEKQKEEIKQKEEENIIDATRVERTLAAVQQLAEREDDQDSYYEPQSLEIVNQDGRRMQLLPADQKALKVGMALHDRAKAIAKQGDLRTALELFLRADTEGFSKCSKELVNCIDNYGLLCLDIAWTWYQLKDLHHLRDAGWRLKKAEECLERTYGKDMARLHQLKGGAAGAEMVLYVRIYLLRAVAAFHQGDKQASTQHLREAEQKLNALHISDEELADLLAMGFSAREARVALRACERDPGRAVAYVLKRREEQQKAREEERQRRRQRQEQRRYGKTRGGGWVDLPILDRLTEMGFKRRLAAEALKQTDNDELQAMNLLVESPHLLAAAIASAKPSASGPPVDHPAKVAQLQSMGFARGLAVGTLRATAGDVAQALNLLLEGKGVNAPDAEAEPEPAQTSSTQSGEEEQPDPAQPPVAAMDLEQPPTEDAAAAAAAAAEAEAAENERRQREEEKRLQQRFEEEVLESVEEDADAHLDITLDEELAILHEYKALLGLNPVGGGSSTTTVSSSNT